MQKFLNNLKLFTKLNLTTAIAAVSMVLATIMFYTITNLFFEIIEKNDQSKESVQQASNTIISLLHKIDYLTIHSAVTGKEEYKSQSKEIYEKLFKNVNYVKESNYLKNDKNAQKIIKNIENRLKGYQLIAASLPQEVKEDSTDGLYAIMALSSTSQKILKELESLNKKIAVISEKKIMQLNKELFYIKSFSVAFIAFLFAFLLYTNKLILSSILSRIELLKEEVLSFFDLLKKKRDDVIHFTQEGNDEISEIAQIIDNNIYIATDILQKERANTQLIEQKVAEATKELQELNNEIEATQREIVFTMGAIAEERSQETGAHIKRVAEYSLILARLSGLSLKESLLIKNASPMHDIGKVGIPDHILNKPGKLTPQEFEIMKTHAELGYKMLKHSQRSILKAASILAYEHHEKWDGSGYPRGLKGEEIHIYGRITAIADVFDALGSDRVYKKAWPLQKILDFFEEQKGKHFDPHLTELFLDNLEHFLAAKESIERGEDASLSHYIEDFNRVPKYITEV
jgi:HD-GYP domain-containing protein (c-di-GMP phosphodiesterase class II)